MSNKFFGMTAAAVLSGFLGLAAGCNEAPRGAEPPRMSNDDLDRMVTAKINGDTALVTYRIDVDADADKNAVTLSGSVPTQSLRTKAVELAKSANPNLVITDKIDVKPGDVERKDYNDEMATEARARAKDAGDTIGDSMDDAWIHTKIRSKLVGEGELPGTGVNVDVNNNVVTLRGNVSTREDRAEVEQIAKTTEGVKSVRNQLVVKASK
jgi:hyperosmotically inducible protein